MSRLVIRGARVVDPSQSLDEVADIVVSDGVIDSVGPTVGGAALDDLSNRRGVGVVGLDPGTAVGIEDVGRPAHALGGVDAPLDVVSNGDGLPRILV